MSKAKLIGSPWNFAQLWNESIISVPQRPLTARDYIYASEIGGSFIDRYLKMYGVAMTNPPNHRSLRKFSAGHVFEWIVSLVLTMTGVLKSKQLRGEYQLEGMLPVAGRFDFIAGGQVDFEAAKKEIENLQRLFASSASDMPPIVIHAMNMFVEDFAAKFKNNPLKEVVFECKSISSFMSDKIARTNKPMAHHVMQCLHYLLSNDMDESYLVYVSKDDLISYQFSVTPTQENIAMYAEDVRQMTEFYRKGFDKKNPLKFAPPKEKEVIFDTDTLRFSTNYKVEYSPYLSLLYPEYTMPKNYQDRWSKSVSSWNRTFKRCINNDKMTALNLEAIKDAKTVFPNWDELVELGKQSGNIEEDNEE